MHARARDWHLWFALALRSDPGTVKLKEVIMPWQVDQNSKPQDLLVQTEVRLKCRQFPMFPTLLLIARPRQTIKLKLWSFNITPQ